MPPNKQSAIVYGCMVYTVSDADAGFGAFSASAGNAIQGEKATNSYWVSLKGHRDIHRVS